MRPEDINLNNDADEFMQIMKLNQNLEERAKLQDEALIQMQNIIDHQENLADLSKIKEFALHVYITTLEDELDIPKDERIGGPRKH